MYIKKKDFKDRIINSLNNKRYFELSKHFKRFTSDIVILYSPKEDYEMLLHPQKIPILNFSEFHSDILPNSSGSGLFHSVQ